MTTQAASVQAAAIRDRPATGLWRDAWGRLRQEPARDRRPCSSSSRSSSSVIFGPLLAPYPYSQQDLKAVLAGGHGPLPPGSPGHILGTDQLGRDLLSRLLDGARISVSVAFVVQIVIIIIGVPIGAIAGWFGGRTDNVLMRFTDIIYAFPDLLFIILLSVAFRETVFGQALDGLLLVFVAIGITSWVTVARLVRGQMLALKETEFVEAAQAIGVSDRKIVTRHLLPNGMGPIIVAITLGHPGGDPRRGDARLHRHRRPAAAGVVGQPDRRRPEVHPVRAPSRDVPGHRDRPGARRVHVPWRRSARRARSEAEGQAVGGAADDTMTEPDAPSIVEVSPDDARRTQTPTEPRAGSDRKAEKLLTVRSLSTHFFTPDGVVQAVDDVIVRARLRRNARAGRRVGLREERHGVVDRSAGAEPARPDRRRRGHLRRHRRPEDERRRDAPSPRQGDRLHLPGPTDQPQPDADDRLPDRRVDPAAHGAVQCGRAGPGR